MENILGVGSITIADLNDALISGDAPRNPDEGALWIDSSANTPVLKVYKNGSWQPQEIDVNNLDPELSETVTTIVNTLGTLANDGLLTYTDRLQLSVEIASIIGQIPSKQNGNVYPNTLPAYNIIDSLGVGSFSNLRQTARDATVPTDNTYYITLERAYTALNTYLSSLTPRPWDVTTTNKDKNTEVANPDTYRETLLNYYLAEMNLATYTEKRASDAAKEYTDASVQDAITSVDVEYATSTDSTTVPDDDKWDTLAPTWSDGIFIWSRTLTTYKNGTTFISEPVNITGAKGESGGTGAAGRSITKIQEQYYVSDSATERIGGTWENEYPGWEEGKFVWTRSVITFTNPSGTHTTDPISVSGAKGDKGDQGPRGVSITKVDVEYAQSTSSTTAPTTGWSTNAPTWKDNQYIWSRTVTTYSSGNPTQSKPAVITGQKGATGSPGTTGTGISSISEEYAISTSKTTAPASSSFSATRPDWSIGQYIWTRSKIVYKNPTSTSYTTPVVSSEWEAINDLEIGGRNLLRDSGEEVSNGSYNIARYDLTDEIKENEEVTLTIWGELASTKSNFRAYNSGESVRVATLTDNGDGTYSSTFKWKIGTSNNTYLNVFAFTSAQTGISTINKIKLEKGNIATDWTEAPEDTQAKIDEKAGSEYVSTTLKNYNADIVEELDKIVGTVQEDTVTKTEFGTYQQSLETKFTQDAKSYTMDFNNVTSSVQTLEGAVQEEFDEVKKYIRFIDGKIILGEVGNQITLEISKEKISFLQGEDEVAKLTNNELEITDARIKHELRIGDYAFKPRANGSVDFG